MGLSEDDTFDALRKPLTEDEVAFGRRKWIYCDQHLNYHLTGWCTVSNGHKVALEATCAEEAHTECAVRGLKLYRG
jgi:hypothetical protein